MRTQTRHSARLSTLIILIVILSVFNLMGIKPVVAAGTITGTVFQDYNDNGIRNTTSTIANEGGGTTSAAIDNGIAGVVITAYDASGNVAGTATSQADGTYQLNAAGTGPYRIEFTQLPPGYQPGAFGPDDGTTVQFVPDGSTSNVNLGINVPHEYCQDNPSLVTSCYVFGDQVNGPNRDMPVVVSFPYSAGSNANAEAPYLAGGHTLMVPAREVGTTWGLAYARTTNRVYTSAFMKRHAGFGPGGTGAIYQIQLNAAGADAGTTLYADLNAIFGAGTAGADPHDQADFRTDAPAQTWDAVGKIGLGGLAIDDADQFMFVMNLADRRLYRLPLTATPTSANVAISAVSPGPAGCLAGDIRPFAVTFDNTNNVPRLYVGVVCSGENGSALRAAVFTVDPVTLAFGGPVLDFALNYPRQAVNNAFPATWNAWTPTFRDLVPLSNPPANPTDLIYPQPMFTSIAFDHGNMVIGLRDRAGDQAGVAAPADPADLGQNYRGITGGDTLRACGSPATGWTLESNSRCGATGNGPQGNNEGPGTGEYYYRDGYGYDFATAYGSITPPGQPGVHHEVSMGAVTVLPGYPDAVASIFDPIPLDTGPQPLINRGGFRWFVNATGGLDKAYQIFETPAGANITFSKSNGLGGLAALCVPPPIEIGNRVWIDTNLNGIQDPGEPAVPGITVRLYAPNGDLLATATTDTEGTYYFSSGKGTTTPNRVYNVTGLIFNTAGFSVRLDDPANFAAGGPLNALFLTTVNVGGPTAINNSKGILLNGFPRIAFSTLGPGANNHTFDFGFTTTTPPPTPIAGSPAVGGSAGSGGSPATNAPLVALPLAERLPSTGYPPDAPIFANGWVLAAFGLGLLLLISGIVLGFVRRR